MAFNSTKPRVSYTAAGAQVEFPYSFKVYQDTDLLVYLTPSGQDFNADTDILVLTTNYSVVITGDSGGAVTLTAGAASGDLVTIRRSLPVVRNIEYQNSGDLRANTLNIDQNYQAYLIMDDDLDTEDLKAEDIRLEAKMDALEAANQTTFYKNQASGTSNLMPIPSGGQLLGWNTAGSALENKDPGSGGSGTGGQYLGTSEIKAVGYMSQTTNENLILGTSGAPLNGFAIDSLTVEDGGSLSVGDGSVFKVL